MRLEHDWFPADVPANVTIGERSWVYSAHAFLHCRSRRERAVVIGNDTGVYHGTFFELGPSGEVEIGDYCAIVGAIIAADCRVEIGDFAFIAHEVVIADSPYAVPPEACGGRPQTAAGEDSHGDGRIIVGRNCWVGARAQLLAGCRLGEGVIVGAAAVVDFPVPAYSVVAGNPARIVGAAGPTGRAVRE